jgi:glycosyltransferase involved in cell wall biosynthesis
VNIGILLPGFSAHEDDWALPVQQNLARALAQSHDVRIITLRYPHHRRPYTLNDARVYPLGAGQARGLGRLKLWWHALRLVERLHRETAFDVLHAMWADETGLIAAWTGRWLGVPSVVSILGGELVGLREIGYGLQRGMFSHWIVGQALKADRVIVASDYVERLIGRAGYAVPSGRVVRGTLGVDAELFSPTDTPADPYKIINVASLVKVKDQAMLLRAVAHLASDLPVTLDIVGTGGEGDRLHALASELGIRERVNFIGAVAHPELPAYYRRAALCALTSRHEVLAMATLEAAACGLPVVSTAVGTLPDYPSIGVTVPVGDDQALASAIRDLLLKPERRAALGRSARATIERDFTIEGTAVRLLELYASLQPAGSSA